MKTSQLSYPLLLATVIASACESGGPESSASREDAGSGQPEQDVGLRPEQLTGTYLFGISTVLAHPAPIVFMVELAVEARDEQLQVRLRERPIAKQDRVTPVGAWSEWTTGTVDAEGHWDSGTIHVLIPASANAIVGEDTEAEIVLNSELLALRSPDDAAADLSFLCGDVTGSIIDPIPVDDLTGSTFGAARIEDVDDVTHYPELTIDCDHDLPRPLP